MGFVTDLPLFIKVLPLKFSNFIANFQHICVTLDKFRRILLNLSKISTKGAEIQKINEKF